MPIEIEVLQEASRQLVGCCCWRIIAGPGTGSILTLGFGAKVPREIPLSNSTLTPEQRENDPEYGLYVNCVWRLDAQHQVVCGAWDDNQPGGPMLIGLSRLIDHRVTEVLVRKPGLDLELTFDHGLSLTLFCDQVNEEDEYDNYSLFLPQTTLVVGTRSAFILEE